jgi:nucleoside-diphosphate-sugar epimerase
MHKVKRAMDGGPPFMIWGTGKPRRQVRVLCLWAEGFCQLGRAILPVGCPHPTDGLRCAGLGFLRADRTMTPAFCVCAGRSQFIYSLDLARLTVKTLREYDEVAPLILCGDEDTEIAIAEAAQMVASSLRYSQPMQMDTSKADGQFKKTASNRKLRALWPDFEFTPMDKAIQETADWFLANYDTCRK